MPDEKIKYLFKRYLDKTCSLEERKALSAIILSAEDEKSVQELLGQYWDEIVADEDIPEEKAAAILDEILQHAPLQEPEARSKLRKMTWLRIAAAVVIPVLGAGIYLYLNQKIAAPVAALKPKTGLLKNDIAAPSQHKASLITGNGKTIILDSIGNGSIAGNASKLSDHEISYNSTTGKVEYNTLTVPQGSRPMQLKLADGSQVWLNVGSSITYPTAFTGTERRVSITGEAYFEVAKNAIKKFIVVTAKTATEVFGTHFNINGYPDESATKVTLLEGKVKVMELVNNETQFLSPGQQAQISAGIKVSDKIDMDEVMAWRNGLFSFHNAGIEAVVRQLARWYDVQISFEGDIPKGNFSGEIGRDLTLNQVLTGLAQTSVRYRIEDGNKIIILP